MYLYLTDLVVTTYDASYINVYCPSKCHSIFAKLRNMRETFIYKKKLLNYYYLNMLDKHGDEKYTLATRKLRTTMTLNNNSFPTASSKSVDLNLLPTSLLNILLNIMCSLK